MNRRTFLATTGVVVAAAQSGCLGDSSAATDATPERPWPPRDPIESPDGPHHLVIANRTETTTSAWLKVTRDDGGVLVEGRYELPDRRGIRFSAIASWETEHTIHFAISGADVRPLTWTTDACGSGSEGSGTQGSRNALVRLRAAETDDANRVSIVVDECDALVAPQVPVGPGETFRLAE